MKINRNIAPTITNIRHIPFVKPEEEVLHDRIPLYIYTKNDMNIVRVDIIFKAGTWYEPSPLVSEFCFAMLTEGSRSFSSRQIAEILELYAINLLAESSKDYGHISFVCLNKHLAPAIEVIKDIILYPVFPMEELSLHKNRKKERFIIEQNKVSTLARQQFMSSLFGDNHPYGKHIIPTYFDAIDKSALQDFHSTHFIANNCVIVLSGNIGTKERQLIAYALKDMPNDILRQETIIHEINPTDKKRHIIHKSDAMQSAIRIGCRTINKHHPDFIGLSIVSSMLGGYFGSRLMKNLREDKGYTYGVSCHLLSFVHEGFLSIQTETGTEYTQASIEEIYAEIKKMKEEKINEKELSLVKNYLLGQVLRRFDGTFNIADSIISIICHNRDFTYYQTMIEKIKNITASDIQALANTYLQEKHMIEVIAGSYNE